MRLFLMKKSMIDYLWIRKDIHDVVKISDLLSIDKGEIDSNALKSLWFRVTNRSAMQISDQEIHLCMEDIQERVTVIKKIFSWVYEILDRKNGEKMDEQEWRKMIKLWGQALKSDVREILINNSN